MNNKKTKLIVDVPVEFSRRMKEAILFQKGDLKKGDISEFVIKNLEKEINRILEQKEKR
ncbi:MAG: hypothetical protein QXO40_05475 [Candidatus Aenigmatarchaeota archaeon]